MSEANGDSLNWYVVHTHPQQEERTSVNLKTWGIETLTPKVRVNKYNEFTNKLTRMSKHMFPSYIFARFRFNTEYHRVRFTRGVHSVVTFTRTPVPVEDEIIDLLRSRTGEDGLVRRFEELKAGDEVIIKEGRFKDFCGVFDREMQDTDRVRILLNTLSYQAHVVVDRELVQKFSTARLAS
ncbi:MAG TPA: transcription termination/antitermination NusG family protein [Pyrinomonadaceae bacterium]|nr:transcription termination/antitermination NusG family protein [Pyrinomonadaceae bacterium]